jgi:predicted phosphodiesterase
MILQLCYILGAFLLMGTGEISYNTNQMARVSTTTKVLVLSDVHAPFHDEKALAVAEAFQKDFKPQLTIALGDWIDGTYVSTFPKDIEQFDQLDEFESGNELLDRFKPQVYVEGNHEQRFRRKGIVPQGYRRLLDPRRWLNLKKRGIRWVRYSSYDKDVYKLGKLSLIHGFACNLHAAAKTAQRFGSVVFGHTHRIQTFSTTHAGNSCTGWNIGCLCNLHQEYAETRGHDWHHGFGMGYIYKSGNFTFNTVRLIGDRVHIEGKEYVL